MSEMMEKSQKDDPGHEPEPEVPAEPAEIKGCVGATGGGEGASSAIPPEELERLKNDLVGALKTVFDPEIPVNIVDLGLVYDLASEKSPSGGYTVDVKMTLTAPGCGMGPIIAEDARQKIAMLPQVESAKVHIVWDPVWTPQMISAEGRLKLGLE